MAYDARTQNDLAKWWITGTGSVVNRLSEVIDDMPDGPAIYHMDADNAWTAGTGTEWYVATATKPDNVADHLAAWHTLTGIANDQMGSLAVDQWTFDTTNNRVYVRLSDNSDPNAADMRKHYAWDGSGAGPAIMTETVEDAIYQIHLLFEVGDGSTSSILTSLNELVYFDTGYYFIVTAQATLTLGEKTGDWSINGAFWQIDGPVATKSKIMDGGDFYLYGSRLHNKSVSFGAQFGSANLTALNSIFSAEHNKNNHANNMFQFTSAITALTLKDVIFYNVDSAYLSESPVSADDIRVHDTKYGLRATANVVISNVVITTYSISDAYQGSSPADYTLSIVDPESPISVPRIGVRAGNEIREQYSINIHVTDKDGANLSDVTVLLEGSVSSNYDIQQFSVSTIAASGMIVEQIVVTKKWVGTNETLTDYNLHRFTISKPGYETLTLENITIDNPIDWYFELQTQNKLFGITNIVKVCGVG